MSAQRVGSENVRAANEVGMAESWWTRWYTPLVAIGVALLIVLVLALAIVEVLVANAPEVGGAATWTTPLVRADEALNEGDVGQALAWWREARVAALRSGQWEGMIEVGDASRRLGARGGFRRDADVLARDAYRTALLRARGVRSVDGVLRAAVAFGELGDHEVVAQAVRIAEHQAGHDPRAQQQVRAVADRLMTHSLEAEHPTSGGQP
jgi:hypothetical protein